MIDNSILVGINNLTNLDKDNEPIKEYLDVPWESMKKVSSIKKCKLIFLIEV